MHKEFKQYPFKAKQYGARLPALTGNRVLYRDGVPIAVFVAGETRFLEQLDPKEQWDAQNAVLRRHVPAVLAQLA